MRISHKGLAEVVTTFETEEELKTGTPVSIKNGKVVAAAEGEELFGFAASDSRKGAVAVQIGGYAEASYTGTAAYGVNSVSVGTNGVLNFEASDGAVNIKVIEINETAAKVGFML